MESFVEKYLTDTTELFVSSYNERIKSFIKKFMKAQELGYLNDTSCFKFKECDVENIDYKTSCLTNLLMVFRVLNPL